MNVVSAFDGCSGARIALEQAGINVKTYRAFEIDRPAIDVSIANYPHIHQLGDIHKWSTYDLRDVDLLIAGFPCQSWSRAGYRKGLEDPRGSVSLQLVAMFQEMKKLNSNLKFLFENVKMKDEDREFFDDLFGVKSVVFNASLVSGQKRSRMYWCNWEISKIKDQGITLNSLLVNGFSDRDKAYCIDANYHKGGRQIKQYFEKSRRQIVFNQEVCYDRKKKLVFYGNGRVIKPEDIEKADMSNPKKDKELRWRHLLPIEGERLQGMDDNYTDSVCTMQRWKMIGNGFNIPSIVHILKDGFKCR